MILRNPNHTHAAHVHPSDRIASQAKLRAFVRRKGKGKLTYQISDSRIAPSHQAALVDISENGVGMIATQLLEVGTQLRISLETPHQGQIVSMLAQVRWMTPLAGNQFRVGCRLERRLAYTEMQNFLVDVSAFPPNEWRANSQYNSSETRLERSSGARSLWVNQIVDATLANFDNGLLPVGLRG
jgi:hypothetical protein